MVASSCMSSLTSGSRCRSVGPRADLTKVACCSAVKKWAFQRPVCVSGSFCTVRPHMGTPRASYVSRKVTRMSAHACCFADSDESIPA